MATGKVTMRATLYRQGNWIDVEPQELPSGVESAEDYLVKQEADPDMAAAMQRVRRKIASTTGMSPLARIRLEAGLSQQQLANCLEMQQPNIARWERDPDQISFANMKRLAAALGMSSSELAERIERSTLSQSHE